MADPEDYINLGYLIAKYEALVVWIVELRPTPNGRWSLRWAGFEGNIDGEETTEGTVEELIALMKVAIKEYDPEGVIT
jgi:hypothetical protein